MIKFKLATHTQSGRTMVEVFRDDTFVAGIYGHEKGIQLVSKYFDGVERNPGYPPSVVIKLAEKA